MAPEIVERILAHPDNHWMKGATVECTVLFVDIRGFTGIAENKRPQEIIDLLNDYFSRIYNCISRYQGHINKYIGDEAMVIFGAPAANPDHAAAAVRAGH